LLTPVEGHLALEVGMVGREGHARPSFGSGRGCFAGSRAGAGSGNGHADGVGALCKEIRKSPQLQEEVNRYNERIDGPDHANRRVQPLPRRGGRLARWLLMTRDRLRSGEFRLTHEFLGHMLGVRRVGVNKAARALQRGKLISYSRGKIRILDQRGLEAASCSCYEIVKGMHDSVQD